MILRCRCTLVTNQRRWSAHPYSYRRGLDQYGQAPKGAWGMSWRQEAMKGVEVCEKPGGVDKRTLIPGFLN